jgi:hypothetical protein
MITEVFDYKRLRLSYHECLGIQLVFFVELFYIFNVSCFYTHNDFCNRKQLKISLL